MNYGEYDYLKFERPEEGILLVTINRPEKLNATNRALHGQLASVWKDIDQDADTRVVIITGEGREFSVGGDLDMIEDMTMDFSQVAPIMKEAADIVYNIIECRKPVISAINGVAVGAGLAVALMADISIISEDARITDGHIRLGVGAGDHACIIWPLLCGLAKAKYYLLTADFIDGKEAERIGLCSKAVPSNRLIDASMETARKIASGPQFAINFTKRSLNHWVRMATPIFEASLAYEMLNFFDKDVVEGTVALKERRDPKFPSCR